MVEHVSDSSIACRPVLARTRAPASGGSRTAQRADHAREVAARGGQPRPRGGGRQGSGTASPTTPWIVPSGSRGGPRPRSARQARPCGVRAGGGGGSTHDPLFVPCDETSAWAWLAVTPERCFGGTTQAVIGESDRTVSVALGEPAFGVEGSAEPIAKPSAPSPGPDRPAGPTSGDVLHRCRSRRMMCSDTNRPAVVGETLARWQWTPSAIGTSRDRAGSSRRWHYTATADQLFVHRNTAQYRSRRRRSFRAVPSARAGRCGARASRLPLARQVVLATRFLKLARPGWTTPSSWNPPLLLWTTLLPASVTPRRRQGRFSETLADQTDPRPSVRPAVVLGIAEKQRDDSG